MVRPGMGNVRAFTEDYKPKSRLLEAEMNAPNQTEFRRQLFRMGRHWAKRGFEDSKRFAQEEARLFFDLGRTVSQNKTTATKSAQSP